MKKLLNSLFILSEDTFLTLDGENIVIKIGDDTVGRYPLHNIESIHCFSYKGATPALMGACCERGIGLAYYNPYGKFLASIKGSSIGNVLLRKEQYRISDSEERSCLYARNMIFGKVFNARWCIERTIRDHAHRVETEQLRNVSQVLKNSCESIREVEDLDTLRGIEGELASQYFSTFNELIINQKEEFQFNKRSRRPPLDKVNALLSFAYTLLASDCANALEGVGLDSYVGFMHRDRPGRKSLALDLMEELRSSICDRFVLTLINSRIVNEKSFEVRENDEVLLTEKGRKQFITAWQNHKKDNITHPYLKEKVSWGLVPHIQALLLARAIRGDIDQYPPFLWK